MPQTPHVETHFEGSETVRDMVIGMSDGLTVPFPLAAGLSGAVQSTGIVITAGLAEVAELPERETEEVAEVFRSYGVPENVVSDAARAISADPSNWVDFMMRFELGLEAPDPGRARRSAFAIAKVIS